MEISWLSLLPVLLAIILAFTIKNVFVSLLVGIIASGIIIDIKTHTTFNGFNSIYKVFQDDWAVKSILFCLLIGAFVYIIEASGGVQGTVDYLIRKRNIVKSKRGAQLIAYLLGILMFIDGTSSIVISGVASKPFFDYFDVPRNRLAYITDSTSSPVAWLIPFNAAGAFLIAMIGGQVSLGVLDVNPTQTIISAMPFQLYGIIAIIIVGFVIINNKSSVKIDKKIIKPIKNVHEDDSEIKQDVPNPKNMVIPLLLLVSSILLIMAITNDGSTGIYIGGIITVISTGVYYIFRGVVTLETYSKWVVKGMSNYLGITMILTLAFAFSNLTSKLGTGMYIASLSSNINPIFVPLIIFLIGAIISFATGTSAGTVAILMPIALPMAVALKLEIPIVIGAMISGGVFGDHCSPISDSTILSSMVAEVNVMDHVKTQMPYVLVSGVLSCVGFLILGIIK